MHFLLIMIQARPFGHLKDAIKEKKSVALSKTDANALKLWKVNVPESEKYEIKEGIDIKDKFRGEILFSDFNIIGDHFKEQPPSRHIHIIIELSLSATTDVDGTMLSTTEEGGVSSYEGIVLNSPDICRRDQTIHKLVEKIKKEHFLLVRSPPMFEKTSLGQLLEQHLANDPNIRVIRISLIWMGNPSGFWTLEKGFQRLMSITWKKFQEECFHIKTIFIVDEVQI
ncbi:hypothetical protein RclHR1_05780002 [Rhizophagus clarus]|uniref:Crinkler (CRN) family protein n=1 Tax=Rhizophagus clarus TaxID=94130 RepID=A0A2Z6RQP3_9GLOM|nr:hypothetical protein RclHR1_05780002 [Rhizophagus clarus]GES73769.1 crinkler (CRN) family protein [Rhizophagus clarus]